MKEPVVMESKTIDHLEEQLQHAMLTSNVPVLDELIADDLVWTMHTGQVVNKQFDLDAHRSGDFQFTKVDVSDRQLHPYGNDCVVVTLKADLAGIFNGQAFSATYRFTRVWMQRANRWQVIAGHVS
jgi:ketosteroid isomerase-like protein